MFMSNLCFGKPFPHPELEMAKSPVTRIGCLAALTLATSSALPLDAGNIPLSRKGLILGTTLAGAAMLATHQVMQHGLAHQPVAKNKPHDEPPPQPTAGTSAVLAASNRTELAPLNLTLPEPTATLKLTDPVGTAAGKPKAGPRAEPPAQGEAARVDALVLAAQKVFPASLCPGELPHTLRAHPAHRESRKLKRTWSQEQADAWYRQNAQELATQDEVRNYQERVETALATLHTSACTVLRKFQESGKPYKQKRGRLRDGILNLRRLQAQFLDDELNYNRKVSDAFGFAQQQAQLGHSGWEEAEGALPYRVRLEVCDAEWDKMEAFVSGLVDTMAPILVEMMPGNTTGQGKDRRRWHFKLGW